MSDFLCPECGVGRIRPIEHAVYESRYKVFPRLVAKGPVTIPTCSHCKEEFTGPEHHAQLEAALKAAYPGQLRQRAVSLLDRLANHGVSQREVEKQLDLSPGYLSKVRGEKVPSASLVACLALLAEQPRERHAELTAFWAGHTVNKPGTPRFVDVQSTGTVEFDGDSTVPLVPRLWGRPE